MFKNIAQMNVLIKRNVSGLTGFSKLVIYEAMEYFDHETSSIRLPSLNEFASDFIVDSAPGRKAEKITPDTIRNAFRTIKKFKGDHFKFRSESQRIVIEMPFIRELYENHKTQEVTAGVATDVTTDQTQAMTDNNQDSQEQVTVEVTAEDAAATSTHIENIYNKHNSNKQTSCGQKLPIADDFYPSRETIQLATSRGFLKVTDPKEIARFIAYNKANETRWEDFNTVYLGWLDKCFTHKPKQKVEIKTVITTNENATNENATNENATNENATNENATNERIVNDEPCSRNYNSLDTISPMHADIAAGFRAKDKQVQQLNQQFARA